MAIYWIFLVFSLVIWFWCSYSFQIVPMEGGLEKRAFSIQGGAFFAVIVFFCGLRSGIGDTGLYIHMFNSWPESIGAIDWETVGMEKGFYFLSVAYKQFISTDYHGWLFFWAFISGVATVNALLRYSDDFGMSGFLFIASTIFVYMFNGMRQYVAVSIVLACSHWLYERKYIRFVLLLYLLSFIHNSTLFLIPFCFLVNARPWSLRMLLTITAAIIVGLFFYRLLPSFEFVLEDTTYEHYIDYFYEHQNGSNIFRLLIAAVPCMLALLGRQIVEKEGNAFINLAVNMSVVNLGLYFIATFSNGMVVGRLTTYFDIYNIILLPWLIGHVFNKESAYMVKFMSVGFYIAYFYYQMVVTWHIGYESDILGLRL